jgi:outer membrane PBP1 activator LpoA protein
MVILMLVSCGTTRGPANQATDSREKRQGLNSYQLADYFTAASLLYEAHQQTPNDPEVFNALLDSWFQLGEYVRIWQLLNQSLLQTGPSQVVEAELMAFQQQCQLATDSLGSLDPGLLDSQWQQRYWQLQSQCQAELQAWLNAAVALIRLNQLLEDPAALQMNNDQIVRHLIRVSQDELIMMIGATDDALLQGWIEAAYINFGADGISGAGWLNEWGNHPASYYFLDLNRVRRFRWHCNL